MRVIAHRGNTAGRNPERENTSGYIEAALEKGFDAEIDVWLIDGEYYLGHDRKGRKEMVSLEWLRNSRLWVHCKNKAAYDALSMYRDVNAFEHHDEPFVNIGRFRWYHSKTENPTARSEIPFSIIHEDNFPVGCGPHVFRGIYTDNADSFRHYLDARWTPEAIFIDVDGVMTNGRKTVDIFGKTISKEFCDKDWTAIKRFQAAGYRVIGLSADIWNQHIFQGRKVEFLLAQTTGPNSKLNLVRRMGFDLTKCVYIGDDYYDLELLWHVGEPCCPSDAIKEVGDYCNNEINGRVIEARGGENCIAKYYEEIEYVIRENFPHEP